MMFEQKSKCQIEISFSVVFLFVLFCLLMIWYIVIFLREMTRQFFLMESISSTIIKESVVVPLWMTKSTKAIWYFFPFFVCLKTMFFAHHHCQQRKKFLHWNFVKFQQHEIISWFFRKIRQVLNFCCNFTKFLNI